MIVLFAAILLLVLSPSLHNYPGCISSLFQRKKERVFSARNQLVIMIFQTLSLSYTCKYEFYQQHVVYLESRVGSQKCFSILFTHERMWSICCYLVVANVCRRFPPTNHQGKVSFISASYKILILFIYFLLPFQVHGIATSTSP